MGGGRYGEEGGVWEEVKKKIRDVVKLGGSRGDKEGRLFIQMIRWMDKGVCVRVRVLNKTSVLCHLGHERKPEQQSVGCQAFSPVCCVQCESVNV